MIQKNAKEYEVESIVEMHTGQKSKFSGFISC